MNKKEELTILALIVGWLVWIGLVAPWLFSAESDIAVALGFGTMLAFAYYTYRFLLGKFKTKKGNTNEAP